MANIATFEKGTSQLLMGNEAIARGALEAGIGFAAAYPGTPSSEIIGTLAEVAKDAGIYVEWSINEKVALEAAAAAAFAGVRSIVAMKQNGLNVALDYLMGLGSDRDQRAGIVLVTCDDPGAPVQHGRRGLAHRRQVGLPAAAGAGHLPGREGHDPLGLRAVRGAEERRADSRRDAHLARPRRRRGRRARSARPRGEVRAVEPAGVHLHAGAVQAPRREPEDGQGAGDLRRLALQLVPGPGEAGPSDRHLRQRLVLLAGGGEGAGAGEERRHPQAGHHLAAAREARARAPVAGRRGARRRGDRPLPGGQPQGAGRRGPGGRRPRRSSTASEAATSPSPARSTRISSPPPWRASSTSSTGPSSRSTRRRRWR